MKRINNKVKYGILTINDTENYGNRLQNYALQKKIKQFGKVETIKNIQGFFWKDYKKRTIENIKKYIKKIIPLKVQYKRDSNFYDFEKNIRYSKIWIDKKHIKSDLVDKYDKFIIGSDQVWNPYFKRTSEIDFALFAPREKVISYAASFGVSDIPIEKKDFYIEGLNNVNKISVRENRGAKIIKELTGKDAKVVLDPTLLLDIQEWKKVMKKPKYVPSKYILTYFLGNISNERKGKIIELASSNNLQIVNLGKKEYPQYYTAGPSEFLWYFYNANIVFTDSFHGCIFSIIFDKTFYYMNREEINISMNSRIDTLLSKLRLQDRKFINWDNISLKHDYTHVSKILEEEKEKSIEFLKNALKVNE